MRGMCRAGPGEFSYRSRLTGLVSQEKQRVDCGDLNGTTVMVSFMRFWWVNHKQTIRQEIEGGYIWSPKTEKGGGRSQSYDNMRRTRPGDFILSYAKTRIAFSGRVSDLAISEAKPTEFGKTGEYWANEGWLVPVDWSPLNNPIRPKDHLSDLQGLLPERYSPIQASTGNGNQKIYLAEISLHLVEKILSLSGTSPKTLERAQSGALIDDDFIRRSEEFVQRAIQNDVSLSETEKLELIRARRGQGTFRRNVERVESHCRVTGLNVPNLLVASHIKPWRVCRSGTERLDGNNGLLLAPHVDRLFDKGLISFEDNGTILVSDALSLETIEKLGLCAALNRKAGAFNKAQAGYLNHHRRVIFLPGAAG